LDVRSDARLYRHQWLVSLMRGPAARRYRSRASMSANAMRRSARDWRERLRDPALTALVIVQIVAIFLLTPLAAIGVPVPPLAGLVLMLAVVSLVVLVSRTRWALVLGTTSLIASVGGVVVREHWHSRATDIA